MCLFTTEQCSMLLIYDFYCSIKLWTRKHLEREKSSSPSRRSGHTGSTESFTLFVLFNILITGPVNVFGRLPNHYWLKFILYIVFLIPRSCFSVFMLYFAVKQWYLYRVNYAPFPFNILLILLRLFFKADVEVHTFNPSAWDTEAGGSLNLRPAWCTEQVPGQLGIHSETLSQGGKRKKCNSASEHASYKVSGFQNLPGVSNCCCRALGDEVTKNPLQSQRNAKWGAPRQCQSASLISVRPFKIRGMACVSGLKSGAPGCQNLKPLLK